MNNTRRKQIEGIKDRLGTLKDMLEEISQELDVVKEEEQEYYDNMPEGIQAGEKGEKADEAIQNLESALDTLQTMPDEIDEVLESLERAQE